MLNAFRSAETIQDLILNCSLKVENGMIVYWPFENSCKSFSLSLYDDKSNGYAYKNGVIAFWYNNEFYVTMYTRKTISILDKTMSKRDMFVPFAYGEYPHEDYQFEKWTAVEYGAKVERANEFLQDSEELSRKLGLRSISNNLLERCFMIPADKELLLDAEGKKLYRYIKNIDSASEWYFGKYVTLNNVTSFVYVNGQTYITRSKNVLEELKDAGFTEGGENMKPQLAHGERILNEYYQSEWMKAF